MSFVKVHSRALEKLTLPVFHPVQPDIFYSPGKAGLAARLYHHSVLDNELGFGIGSRVCVARLSKRSLYLRASTPLEMTAVYEIGLQGMPPLAGYLTPVERGDTEGRGCQYQFHFNHWLTDEQLMRLVIDLD
ncbi:hypothetical protein [Photobacterium sp. TY1-4]|uniref:hypothetical protein n=1 Tax=Photobacterium sp. TY1-4 TaxID=2899122 RepID=UPI0021BEACA3|nr:hypothetical protein [Photobacterium sp. TY1-4]UXI03327.1 hypothetical protein NH461_23160 [Photobacterium sp. TY1-4]